MKDWWMVSRSHILISYALTEAEMQEMEQSEESVDTNKFENDDRKLFVGGLTWETTVEQLKAYFEKYGTVKVSVEMILRLTMILVSYVRLAQFWIWPLVSI